MALSGPAHIAIRIGFAALASLPALASAGCAMNRGFTVTTDIKEVPGQRLGGISAAENTQPNGLNITGTYSTGNDAGRLATDLYTGLYAMFAAINGPKAFAYPAVYDDGTPATAREMREVGCERVRGAGTLDGTKRLYKCPQAPGYLFFIVRNRR